MAPTWSSNDNPALRVTPLGAREVDGFTRLSAGVEGLAGAPEILFYDIDSAYLSPDETGLADPYVLALLFPAMHSGQPIRVEGPVSRSLLANLEYLMGIWALWMPGLYRPVDIRSDREVESLPVDGNRAVALFSGGLDSAFSVLRHHRQMAGRRNRWITVGAFVHGADFRHDDARRSHYTAACRTMLKSLDIDTCVVRTNVRDFQTGRWSFSHGAALSSCLHWFAGSCRYGIMGATVTADLLNVWGSHPLTDRYLSSDRFEIQDDGALASRVEKADLVRTWPEAMDGLRVCYQPDVEGLNCGTCRKCIHTKLAFMACGGELPMSLRPEQTWREVLLSERLPPWAPYLFERVLATARQRGLSSRSWYRAIALKLWMHRVTAPASHLARRARKTAKRGLVNAGAALGRAAERRGRSSRWNWTREDELDR